MFKKRELILFSRDRLALVLLAMLFLGALVLCLISLVNARPTDVQVPIRYSSYGFTNFYRDKWYTLLGFGLFGILLCAVNGIVAIKVHQNSRGLAIGVLSLSIFICLVGLIVASQVFRLAASSL